MQMKTAIIVGAGVAGLQAARALLKRNFGVTILEQGSSVGGVWCKAYRDSKLQVPYKCFEFGEHPWPEGVPDSAHPSAAAVQSYVEQYAERFGLLHHIQFGCRVKHITPSSEGGWYVTYIKTDGVSTGLNMTTADCVVICTGFLSTPYVPAYKDSQAFGGQQLHASFFSSPSVVDGKQVVVIGGGRTEVESAAVAMLPSRAAAVTCVFRQVCWPTPHQLCSGVPLQRQLLSCQVERLLPPYYTAGRLQRAFARLLRPLQTRSWTDLERDIARQFGLQGAMVPPASLQEDLLHSNQALGVTWQGSVDQVVMQRASSHRKGVSWKWGSGLPGGWWAKPADREKGEAVHSSASAAAMKHSIDLIAASRASSASSRQPSMTWQESESRRSYSRQGSASGRCRSRQSSLVIPEATGPKSSSRQLQDAAGDSFTSSRFPMAAAAAAAAATARPSTPGGVSRRSSLLLDLSGVSGWAASPQVSPKSSSAPKLSGLQDPASSRASSFSRSPTGVSAEAAAVEGSSRRRAAPRRNYTTSALDARTDDRSSSSSSPHRQLSHSFSLQERTLPRQESRTSSTALQQCSGPAEQQYSTAAVPRCSGTAETELSTGQGNLHQPGRLAGTPAASSGNQFAERRHWWPLERSSSKQYPIMQPSHSGKIRLSLNSRHSIEPSGSRVRDRPSFSSRYSFEPLGGRAHDRPSFSSRHSVEVPGSRGRDRPSFSSRHSVEALMSHGRERPSLSSRRSVEYPSSLGGACTRVGSSAGTHRRNSLAGVGPALAAGRAVSFGGMLLGESPDSDSPLEGPLGTQPAGSTNLRTKSACWEAWHKRASNTTSEPPAAAGSHLPGSIQVMRGDVSHFTPAGVTLTTGQHLPADVVLYCTGFVTTYEYLDGSVRDQLGLQKDGLYLYRNVLPPRVPNLAFVGSEVSSHNALLTAGLQAEWLAAHWAGAVQLPPAAAMQRDVDKQMRWRRKVMPVHKTRGAAVQLYMSQYHAQLMQDLGLKAPCGTLCKRSRLLAAAAYKAAFALTVTPQRAATIVPPSLESYSSTVGLDPRASHGRGQHQQPSPAGIYSGPVDLVMTVETPGESCAVDNSPSSKGLTLLHSPQLNSSSSPHSGRPALLTTYQLALQSQLYNDPAASATPRQQSPAAAAHLQQLAGTAIAASNNEQPTVTAFDDGSHCQPAEAAQSTPAADGYTMGTKVPGVAATGSCWVAVDAINISQVPAKTLTDHWQATQQPLQQPQPLLGADPETVLIATSSAPAAKLSSADVVQEAGDAAAVLADELLLARQWVQWWLDNHAGHDIQ